MGFANTAEKFTKDNQQERGLHELAKQQEKEGNYDDALDSYNKAIKMAAKTNDKEGAIHILDNVAALYIGRRYFKQAWNIYKILEKLDPEPSNLSRFFYMGYVKGSLKDYKESLKFYIKYFKAYPTDLAVLNNIAWTYQQLNNYEQSLYFYDLIITIDPYNVETINSKILLLENWGDDKKNEVKSMCKMALKVYDKILNKGTKDDTQKLNLLVGKAIALDILDKKEEALHWYDEALKIDKNNSFALYNKSCTSALLKRVDDALDLLQRAVKVSPAYKELAKDDKDFNEIKGYKRFKEIVE